MYYLSYTSKIVDAEDIVNEKIRTHDLTLDLYNSTKQFQTPFLYSAQNDQFMITQPGVPNNKIQPAYKICCSYRHKKNHSISTCFKKQRSNRDKRQAYASSKSPQKSIVQYFPSPSRGRTKRHDTRCRSRSS